MLLLSTMLVIFPSKHVEICSLSFCSGDSLFLALSENPTWKLKTWYLKTPWRYMISFTNRWSFRWNLPPIQKGVTTLRWSVQMRSVFSFATTSNFQQHVKDFGTCINKDRRLTILAILGATFPDCWKELQEWNMPITHTASQTNYTFTQKCHWNWPFHRGFTALWSRKFWSSTSDAHLATKLPVEIATWPQAVECARQWCDESRGFCHQRSVPLFLP